MLKCDKGIPIEVALTNSLILYPDDFGIGTNCKTLGLGFVLQYNDKCKVISMSLTKAYSIKSQNRKLSISTRNQIGGKPKGT